MRSVSKLARLTFIQLWLVADDAGRLDARRPMLARRLYPGDAEAIDLLPGWLAELEREHCIESYTVEGIDYLRIVNWRRHQKIYHPTASRLPARPREALGSDCEKPNDTAGLGIVGEIPERVASVANGS
jgi:hypothetical protein